MSVPGASMSSRNSRVVSKNYFRDFILHLKLTGLWEPDPNSKVYVKVLYFLYNSVWFCCQYLHVVPSEFMTAIHGETMAVFVRNFRDCTNHATNIFKFSNWFVWRKDMKKLMKTMENYTLDYEDCGSFKPMEIVEFQRKRAIKWATRFRWTVHGVLGSMFFNYAVFIFFERDLFMPSSLTVSIYWPVRNDTKALHVATAAFMAVQFSMCPYGQLILDTLFILLATQIIAQFNILCGALRTIKARSTEIVKRESEVKLHDVMNEELRKCIRHLHFIYRISAQIEQYFLYQSGVQIMLSWTQVCFNLFLITGDGLSANGVGDLVYLTSTMSELFVFCNFSDHITTASRKVREALYDCNWEEGDQKFRRAVLISMTRLIRPVQISVVKLTPLNLELFLSVIRGGYSLFTILQTRGSLENGSI